MTTSNNFSKMDKIWHWTRSNCKSLEDDPVTGPPAKHCYCSLQGDFCDLHRGHTINGDYYDKRQFCLNFSLFDVIEIL